MKIIAALLYSILIVSVGCGNNISALREYSSSVPCTFFDSSIQSLPWDAELRQFILVDDTGFPIWHYFMFSTGRVQSINLLGSSTSKTVVSLDINGLNFNATWIVHEEDFETTAFLGRGTTNHLCDCINVEDVESIDAQNVFYKSVFSCSCDSFVDEDFTKEIVCEGILTLNED